MAISVDINIVGCYPRVSEASRSASPAVGALTFNREANRWATFTVETEPTCKIESKLAYTKHYPSSFSHQLAQRGRDAVMDKAKSVGKVADITLPGNILQNNMFKYFVWFWKTVGEHKGQTTVASLASIYAHKTHYFFLSFSLNLEPL